MNNNKVFVTDVENKILGRISSKIAYFLMGKNKINFKNNVTLIVINVDKILVSGKKFINKKYYYHSNYPGGLKIINFKNMQNKFPCRILRNAVRGMLPKGPFGYFLINKLKIYSKYPFNLKGIEKIYF